MLLNDLYNIQSLTEAESRLQCRVQLMADHPIFKGHFPGQPVLPGVCMMEMVAEIFGEFLHQGVSISGAPLVKFLQMIDPEKNPVLFFEINIQETEPETTHVNGKIFFESQIFMKFQLRLRPDPVQ